MVNEVQVLVQRENEDCKVLGNLNVEGNVGIGTTNPMAKLTVCGVPSTPNIETADIMRLYRIAVPNVKNTNSASLRLGSFEEGINGRTRLDFNLSGAPCNENHWGLTPDVNVMSLLGNGNVGIGTSNPAAKLEVSLVGSSWNEKLNTALRIHSPDPSLYMDLLTHVIGAGNAGFSFRTTKDALTIDTNGNVGIGKTTPKYTLDVNGTINASEDIVIGGGDCAEEFDIIDAKSIEPGTVMVIDNNGALRASEKPYDKRVAGVISGAGDLRPGITLDKRTDKSSRLPLALNGKVYCKVDADCAAVEVGDLLTTSSRYGYAMKVDDHVRSIGAIIGKALRPLETGCGLIPILVALQ